MALKKLGELRAFAIFARKFRFAQESHTLLPLMQPQRQALAKCGDLGAAMF